MKDFYLLRMRELIAVLELDVSQANHELAKYGEWQSNHLEYQDEVRADIANVRTQYLESIK